jgi:hypothetical protein
MRKSIDTRTSVRVAALPEATGGLWHWYPGKNGVPGEKYEGEAGAHDGPEMWRLPTGTGRDMALALLTLDAEGRLA